jgi:electron transfer flavoprotein alpha/beta subunit
VTQSERDVAEHERQRTQLRQSGEASTTTSETPAVASAQQELFKADFTSMREHINALRNHAMTLPNSDALAEVLLAVESAELGISRAERLVLNLPDESAERP